MRSINRRIDVPVAVVVTILAIIALGVAGWIANIVKLVGIAQATDPNYVMAALRGIGIFVAPLGAILGLFV